MGDPHAPLTAARPRLQQMTLIYTVMVGVTILILLQFLLFQVTLGAYLSGKEQIVWPATGASGLCFAAACWLIRYLLKLKPSAGRPE